MTPDPRATVADSTAREIAERLANENWEVQSMCDGCRTATWCAHFKQCLADTVPPVAALADAEARVRQAEKDRDTSIRASAQNGERWSKAVERLAAVEQALRDYGRHKIFCKAFALHVDVPCPACSCGLFAALGDPQ